MPASTAFASPLYLLAAVEPLDGRRLFSAGLPGFAETDLVSDLPGIAAHTDPNLVNPWGVTETKAGVVWVANNATGTSTAYDAAGNAVSSGGSELVVTVPPPAGAAAGAVAAPSGEVLNTGKGFVVTSGGAFGASRVCLRHRGRHDLRLGPARQPVGRHAGRGPRCLGAVYKGLALVGSGKKQELLATNFHSGKIEAYDSKFAPVALPAGTFADASVPAGFAPFNVQAVGPKVFVTFARQDDAGHDDVAGPGNGFVDVFDARGRLQRRFASGGPLNSPWAVAPVPGGRFGGDVLIGNFGDGAVNVFNSKGAFLGAARTAAGRPLAIPGLWGLAPGVGKDKKDLFFTAGPAGESHGIFGTLLLQAPAKVQHSTTGAPVPAGGNPYVIHHHPRRGHVTESLSEYLL